MIDVSPKLVLQIMNDCASCCDRLGYLPTAETVERFDFEMFAQRKGCLFRKEGVRVVAECAIDLGELVLLFVADEEKHQFSEIDGALGYDTYAFLPEQAAFTLCEHFKVKSLDGFGCGQIPQAVAAAGAIIHYLKHQLRRKIDHLTSLRCDAPAHYVVLDAATQTNLELVESRSVRDTSLLAVLDRTVTPMGARKLRAWILQPLRDLTQLECRQQMIADLLQEPDLLASIRGELKLIRDIERAVGRLSQATGNARDLVALKISLQQIPKLKGELQKLIDRTNFGRAGSPSPTPLGAPGGRALPVQLQKKIHEMPALAGKLNGALVDDPPLALKEGGIFRGDRKSVV